MAAPLITAIDDSPTIRKIIEVTLRREGYEVASFADGISALRWMASSEMARPALILVDIMMPKLDGYEFARILKGRPELATIPIVMISRRTGILDHLKARLAGACDYLSKPITQQQLVLVVQQHLTPDAPSNSDILSPS